MTGYLPAGTSLQLGDTLGNISHQGVLTSNVNGTTLLPTTFPSSSTGSSTAHAHYTETGSNALQFLNASASGIGGHQFFVSTSTDAPLKTFDVNKDRLQLDSLLINTPHYTSLDMVNNELLLKNKDTPYLTSRLNGFNLIVSDLSLSNKSYVRNNNVSTGNDVNRTYATLTGTQLTIENQNTNINSILTSTDLTFNGVSLPTRVSTNATNINTLQIKQTNVLNVYNSPAIYADGAPPLAVPTSINNTYAQQGWYFKNITSGLKINWYIPPSTGLLVQDILGLYLRLFNCSTTSNDNTLFLTVYTVPDSGPNYSWYKSKMTYVITATPTVNTNYTFFANPNSLAPNPSHYASTLLSMSPSPVNNPRGLYGPTETVMFFSIGSNSASAINSVECVVQKFGVMTSSGTQEFNFIPLL